MKTKVYIDGQAGTTGLQIFDRIGSRDDLELLRIAEEKRHDNDERKKFLNAADIVFLCLPDDGAREAVSLIDNPNVRVIDASTAHRTADGWTYGFPEASKEQRAAIASGKRIANPGCHATGFLASAIPLVRLGILPKDYPVTCYSLTGYSGGGKKMIADYESPEKPEKLFAPGIYGLTLKHKHVPEMLKMSGLDYPPVFNPIVDDYYKGMATAVMLQNRLLRRSANACRSITRTSTSSLSGSSKRSLRPSMPTSSQARIILSWWSAAMRTRLRSLRCSIISERELPARRSRT